MVRHQTLDLGILGSSPSTPANIMCFDILKKVAEAVETALLEEQACREITSYSLDVIPDDRRIVVVKMLNRPIKNIKATIILGSDATNHSRQP